MRKPLFIVVSLGFLGAAYWLVSSMPVEQRPSALSEMSGAAIESPRPAPTMPPPSDAAPQARAGIVDAMPVEAEAELDADGDHHDEQPAELRALTEPPAATEADPDPAVGEAEALGEARSMLQTLVAESDDPAARREAQALLEAIDARGR